MEKEESQVEVTPNVDDSEHEALKRMLIDKYSPGTSAAAAG